MCCNTHQDGCYGNLLCMRAVHDNEPLHQLWVPLCDPPYGRGGGGGRGREGEEEGGNLFSKLEGKVLHTSYHIPTHTYTHACARTHTHTHTHTHIDTRTTCNGPSPSNNASPVVSHQDTRAMPKCWNLSGRTHF